MVKLFISDKPRKNGKLEMSICNILMDKEDARIIVKQLINAFELDINEEEEETE
jgi:hypothetical protein